MQHGKHARPAPAGGRWPWRRGPKGARDAKNTPVHERAAMPETGAAEPETAPADEMPGAPVPGMDGPAAPDIAAATVDGATDSADPATPAALAPAQAAGEPAPNSEIAAAGPAAEAAPDIAPAAAEAAPTAAPFAADEPPAPAAEPADQKETGAAEPDITAATADDMTGAPAPGMDGPAAPDIAAAPADGATDSADPATPADNAPAGPADEMPGPAATPAPENAAPAAPPADADASDDRPGLAALRSAFAAAEAEKQAAGSRDDWALAPAEKPRTRRLRLAARVGLAAVFLLAVGLAWPGRTSQGGLAVASATPRPTPGPTADLESVFTLAQGLMPTATPRPTLEPFDIDKFTAEQIALLDEATEKDDKEITYDSAEDYFGSGDVTLDIYYFPENVPMATNVPTAAPTAVPTATPGPTAAPTAEPAPTPTLAPGETPGPTPEPTAVPEATAVPTATPGPTAAPTAAPADGPVLQGSGTAACVLTYNAWDDSLKLYTWQTARAYGVSYELVLSIIYHESRFQAGATHLNTNGTTDWGLMQINDVCFSLLHQQLGLGSMSELLDPYKAVQAGCAILAYHLRYTGNEDDALLRYQVGAGNYAYYKANGTVPLSYTNTIALRSQYYAAGI